MRRRLLPIIALAMSCGHVSSPSSTAALNTDLTLETAVMPSSLAGLVISSGHLSLEDLAILGDSPENDRSSLNSLPLDLTAGMQSHPFLGLSPGLYSRLRFDLDDFALEGSWNGIPLTIHYDIEDFPVDLLTSAEDVEPGRSVSFHLSMDMDLWFTTDLLNRAQVDGGEVRIDFLHNQNIAVDLIANMAASVSLTASSTM